MPVDATNNLVTTACELPHSFAAMHPIASRLREAREARGLSQGELAEIVGMSQQGIAEIETGGVGRPRKLLEIARAVGKSPEWLLGREMDAPLKSKPKNGGQLGNTPEKTIPEIDLRAGASYGGGMSDHEWQDGDQAGHEAVAKWGLPPAYVEKELGLTFGFADIIQVRGDSMDDGSAKALVSGDRVIIDRRDTDPRQGGVFAVYDGAGVIIKQVELVRGGEVPRIICKSRNPHFDPIPLVLDGNVHIIGRVAGKISRM